MMNIVGDQAAKLRQIVTESNGIPEDTKTQRLRSIAITSGKGGVGKTNIATNLAIALAEKTNKKIYILDADLGLANIDVILGITPKYNLAHVIRGEKKLEEILVKGPMGVNIIPGTSGVSELANLSKEERERFLEKLSSLEKEDGILIIDTGAGIDDNVLDFVLSSDEVIVVTTPEPTAITDAYALIKIISASKSDVNINLLVNMVKKEEEFELVTRGILLVAKQFLGVDIKKLGYVYYDNVVSKSVLSQDAFYILYPDSIATKCINNIALSLLNKNDEVKNIKKPTFFRRLLNSIKEKVG